MENERPDFPITIREERTIQRITVTGVVTDAISAFNIERGLIYTLKLLFTKPGRLLSLYLHDGRFRIFNAFRLLLLTTGLSLFLLYLLAPETFFTDFSKGFNDYGSDDQIDPKNLQNFFLDWYNLILWVAIPVYALFSYLFNRKAGYNYAEHLVMQTYQICAINVITILLVGLTIITSSSWILYVMLVISLTYYLWMLAAWMHKRGFWFMFKNILAYVLANLVYIVITSLVSVFILIKMQ
ncbi:hypothetical protein [Marinoscillum sp.]|uniref:hypothetical protein n=1 Tax=Marinoscillum sp. TaxID=2024838 RepID=UPI003BA97098